MTPLEGYAIGRVLFWGCIAAVILLVLNLLFPPDCPAKATCTTYEQNAPTAWECYGKSKDVCADLLSNDQTK